MVQLAFRSSAPKNGQRDSKWRDANPFRIIGRSYILVDDTIHRSVNRTAEKIENSRIGKRFGLTDHRRLAYPMLSLSFLVDSTIHFSKGDIHRGTSALFAMPFFLLFWRKFEPKFYNSITNTIQALNFGETFVKMIRFPNLLLGMAWTLGELYSKGSTFFSGPIFIALAIVDYLRSSSNGMLDRLKKFVADAYTKVKEALSLKPPVPQPVEVKD